jgi:hypothetical protein
VKELEALAVAALLPRLLDQLVERRMREAPLVRLAVGLEEQAKDPDSPAANP